MANGSRNGNAAYYSSRAVGGAIGGGDWRAVCHTRATLNGSLASPAAQSAQSRLPGLVICLVAAQCSVLIIAAIAQREHAWDCAVWFCSVCDRIALLLWLTQTQSLSLSLSLSLSFILSYLQTSQTPPLYSLLLRLTAIPRKSRTSTTQPGRAFFAFIIALRAACRQAAVKNIRTRVSSPVDIRASFGVIDN